MKKIKRLLPSFPKLQLNCGPGSNEEKSQELWQLFDESSSESTLHLTASILVMDEIIM